MFELPYSTDPGTGAGEVGEEWLVIKVALSSLMENKGTNMNGLIGICIVTIGLPYILLGFIAYSDRKSTSSKLEAAGPWWALYPKNYNKLGKSLSLWGRLLLILALLTNIYLFIDR